jgi:heterodisulfide reductase subunit A
MSRIGVFVCHCGENIAGTVDVAAVVEAAWGLPDVAFAADYRYMCSDPGQRLLKDAVREHGLTGVVVAACSPQMHEPTFRTAATEAGLNRYLCEMANVREQCAWVHLDQAAATAKAIDQVRLMVEKVRRNRVMQPIQVPITKRALVIGGGIAGIQAALDIADGGTPVTLVEREPSIGGHMAQLSETFPTLDCSQCILTPRMVEAARHPNIELLTLAEVQEVTGSVGQFQVKILQKPRYVLADKCTACGDCASACPQAVPNPFERNLAWRRAIDIPFPQAVPAVYYLDPDACLGLNPLVCERCYRACDLKAIDFDQQPTMIEREVGAIVVATGYELYPAEQAKALGWGKHPDVLTGLEFERLLSASGPTGGELRRPSDGQVPKEVVFVQCVGSRDPAQALAYCSKICCMYTAKHAMLYRHKVPDGRATVFYMDIRAGGKGYEEFIQRVMEEDRVLYLRGRVSRIVPEDGRLLVWGADTLSGQKVEIAADLVVLATAMVPSPGWERLSQALRLGADSDGFYSEAHPKLRPVEALSAGLYLAGAAQAPKDIPEAVAQASAAASKAQVLFSQPWLAREPCVASADEVLCVGCFECEAICPFGAISRKDVAGDHRGPPVRQVAQVNPGVCAGCGACVAACRGKAMALADFSDQQLLAEVAALGWG